MSRIARKYREHAAELRGLAERTEDKEEKACLRALAAEWIKLADRIEQAERFLSPSSRRPAA
jgi:hypothetical protein